MTNLDCRKCKKCNCKGKPSVTKGSMYCDKQRKLFKQERESIYARLKRLKKTLFQKRERQEKIELKEGEKENESK